MRYWYIIICFCIIYPFSLLSQEYDLSGMQGIKDKKGTLHFEVNGYEITLSFEKGDIDNEKTFDSIKKKYKIKNILSEYRNDRLAVNHKVIETTWIKKENPGLEGIRVCYLLNQPDGIAVICFYTDYLRSRDLEQEFILTYLGDELLDYVDEPASGYVAFAGRDIKPGREYEIRGARTISGKNGGISWSEFPSLEEAIQHLEFRITADKNSKNSILLMEEDIEVLFEDVPTIAYRAVYMQSAGMPLIVYYVAEEIRGRYISCTLSNYGYNRYDYELSPLLEEVLFITELPDDAYDRFDIPAHATLSPEEKKVFNQSINLFEVRLGTWLPVGSLRNTFEVAPSFGLFAGWAFNYNTAVDFGFQMAFPIASKSFKYYYSKNDYDYTETDIVLSMGLRLRHQITLAKNVHLTPYTYLGINLLTTDLEKEVYESDYDQFHSVNTLDLSTGVNLRYKTIGGFVEYHYTPYCIASKVRNGFGASALSMGLSVSF